MWKSLDSWDSWEVVQLTDQEIKTILEELIVNTIESMFLHNLWQIHLLEQMNQDLEPMFII